MFRNKTVTIALVSAIIASGFGVVIINPAINANAQSNTDEQDTVTIQKTEVSSPDPCIPATCSYVPLTHQHQLVMALPPRNDGKVWVGTVTWTASKPVEVLLFQGYNSSVTPDAAHGQPLTTPLDHEQAAISLVKPSSGTPIASGSYPFAGNGLAFHTLDGSKFTVTYTVAATAKKLTSLASQTAS